MIRRKSRTRNGSDRRRRFAVSQASTGRTRTHHGLPESDEARLRVKGLVCAFCAQGLRKKVSKLDFVDTKKPFKGVTVDEKNGSMTVALKPGKAPMWKDLFSAVEKAGYEATEGEALVDGKRVIQKIGGGK